MRKTTLVLICVLFACVLTFIFQEKWTKLIEDEKTWKKARTANTITEFKYYLQVYHNGRHVTQARAQIESLKADDSVFFKAEEQGTLEAYKTFLDHFPGHNREALVRSRIEGDIGEVFVEKKIRVDVHGEDIQNVVVRFDNRDNYPLIIRFPVGTFFISDDPAVQNMISTKEKVAEQNVYQLTIPVVSANLYKKIPDDSDSFQVVDSPPLDELKTFMPILAKVDNANFAVQQAAVWIITDNANFEELGSLVETDGLNRTKVIGGDIAEAAMKIIQEAGIDITQKKIWLDRHHIAKLALESRLYKAVAKGNIEYIKQLLPDKTYEGVSLNGPLTTAAMKGLSDIIELLITKGADVNSLLQPEVMPLSLLCWATKSGKKDAVDVLLAHGAEFRGKYGTWALYIAINEEHYDIAKLLISRGVELNMGNWDGYTPLYIAASKEDKSIVEMLLTHGADPNIPSELSAEFVTTPLCNAVHNGNKDIVDLLITKRADVNMTCREVLRLTNDSFQQLKNEGISDEVLESLSGLEDMSFTKDQLLDAIEWSVEENQVDRYKNLILKYAEKNDATAIDIASSENYPDIVELLRQHGARAKGE